MVLDLDHAAENRRRVSAVRKCLQDDPATLDQAKVSPARSVSTLFGGYGPARAGVSGATCPDRYMIALNMRYQGQAMTATPARQTRLGRRCGALSCS